MADVFFGSIDMVLETPLLRVSRPVAACSRCRSAKIKCDGKLPACTACERANRASECSSTNDQFAKGKERSYVATLEARVEKLERRLNEARTRKASVVSVDQDMSTPSRRPSVDVKPVLKNGKIEDSRAARRREASEIDELVGDFGLLSVNATARDFYGFNSAMSYARLLLAACSKESMPDGVTKSLPPRHSATQHIQYYLNNIFVFSPIFEEASFYASMDAIYFEEQGKGAASPFDHWMVRMVLGIACVAMSEQRGDSHYLDGLGHVNVALRYAEAVLHPGSIASLQAMILLAQFSILNPRHFDSWHLIGAAARAMVDMGLHQDPSKGSAFPKAKLELRRRVFYCIYSLDRMTSIAQARSFAFSDDSTNVTLPFNSNSSSAKSPSTAHLWLQSYDPALNMFRLRQIQSKWYQQLCQSGREPYVEPYPHIWRICASLQDWFDKLPSSILPSLRSYFELEMLYSYVYILSPNHKVPVICPLAQKLVFEYCISYAHKMHNVVCEESTSKPPRAYYDLMRVYMTGRQFLDVLWHSQDALLRGATPPPPFVPPGSPPPPALPTAVNANTDNTARAITCIKQILDLLARFGLHWGYMSWRDRFQRESEATLTELHQRQREIEQGQAPSSLIPTSNAGPFGELIPPSVGFHTRTSSSSNQVHQTLDTDAAIRREWVNMGGYHGADPVVVDDNPNYYR